VIFVSNKVYLKSYSQIKLDYIELVGAIERGEQNVSIDNIQRLAKALRVSIEALFKDM
jgi:hypothetical protein